MVGNCPVRKLGDFIWTSCLVTITLNDRAQLQTKLIMSETISAYIHLCSWLASISPFSLCMGRRYINILCCAYLSGEDALTVHVCM